MRFLFKQIVTIFFSLLFFVQLSNAQFLPIKRYNVQDGLSQSQVRNIVQDSAGYLWFGTYDGLSRFDGLHFKNFSVHNGLAGNNVSNALVDGDSLIWFGLERDGISIYHQKTRKFTQFPLNDSLRSLEITALYKEKNGSLWIGTKGNGLIRYNGQTLEFLLKSGILARPNINYLALDPDSNLWVCTDEGIVIFNPKDYKATENFHHLSPNTGLPAKIILNVVFDHNGNAWVGTREHGLIKVTPSPQGKFTYRLFTNKNGLPDVWIRTIYLDRDESLWVGTTKGVVQISKINSGNPKFSVITTKNGLGHNTVDAILQDYEGNIWFGTWGGGACQYKGRYFETYTMEDGLPNNTVWAIYEDRHHTFWFATEDGLAGFRPNPHTKNLERRYLFNRANGLPAEFILCIEDDGKNGMWLGTWGDGLLHLNPYSNKIMHFTIKDGLPSNLIVSIKRDAHDNLWIATLDSGISYFDTKHNLFKNYNKKNGFPSNLFNYIYRDHQNRYWFATKDKGVLLFTGKKFIRFHRPSDNLPCGVTTMSQDKKGNFWFGTTSSGIVVINSKHGMINHFDQSNGLSGDNIFSILFDDQDHVWIGNKGDIDRFNLKDSTFKHFGIDDGFWGLEPNQNAVFKDSKGDLWFGAIGGAVRYRPEYERTVSVPPKIILNKIRLFFEDKPIPANHRFKYNQNHLTFFFTGFAFDDPKAIKYSFKLNGFDKKWSPPSPSNMATYSNLPPGKYTFYVKAKKANGIWSKRPAQFSFEIRPPFWDHWYFAFGLVLLFVLLIMWLFRLRTANIQKRNKILEEKVKKRTAELEEKTKNLAQAYESLKESETKFRTLSKTTATAIFIYQGEKFIFANQATCTLSGYSLDELLQVHFWDIVHPDYKELIKQRGLARQRGEKVPSHYEFKIIRKDGEERWIDFTSDKIMFDGQAAALGTAFDITDRKKAEEALKESELQLRTLINAMPDIVCFKDGEGRWIEANDFDLKLFRVETVPYKGKKDSELAHYSPFYKEAFLTCEISDERAWQKGTISRGEEIIPQPDGTKKVFDIIKVPIFNDDGSRKGLVVIGRDITEKKKIEEALREEKERLSAILRSIHEGVIATDKNGRILFLNNYARELLGINEPILNLPVQETGVLYSQSKEKFDFTQACQDIQQGKSIHSPSPYILKTKNGDEYFVEFNCAPIKGEKGEIAGSVITFRDVSEKQKLEQELFKARKLESLGILAGGVAHDFNNILTAIIGNISLIKLRMQKEACPEKLMQLLDKAEKASMRAQGLTQQLLTFSKGGAPIKKAATIQELIQSTVEFSLRGSKVRYDIDLPQDLWPVEIDEGQISQVVNNLTINALQAMPKGGYLHIKGRNVHIKKEDILPLPPGRYIKISFTDTGTGISAENLSRIFDPYFTTKKKGSGLGLASTYSIIKKHGGHITVESTLNKGTTFIFYLPASDKKLPEAHQEEQHQTVNTQNARILVMDDESDIRELVKDILENIGFEVLSCADGMEAIKIYEQELKTKHPIDLVILDLTVPGELGGKETLQRLLKIDPKVKAIVSSGYSTDPIMAEYSKYGFKGVVNKPYKVNELIVTVQKILNENS